jgi:hypothetical protein
MKYLPLLTAILALLPGTIRADEGRIAIYQPGTIDRPGSYVLNRDIVVSDGDALVIRSSQVDLDLNGYAIRATGGSGALIRIDDGFTSIRIRNGRLLGNDQFDGVVYGSTGQVPPIALRLEDLEGRDFRYGVMVQSAGSFEILSSDFSSCGSCVVLLSPTEPTGRIVDSRIADAQYEALLLVQSGMEVRGNILSTAPLSNDFVERPGVQMMGHGGIVDGNLLVSIDNPPDPTAGIVLAAPGVQVTNNVLDRHSNGMVIHSDGNHIAGNVIRRNGFNGANDGNGIWMDNLSTDPAAGNLIEVNLIDASLQCALTFGRFSADNAWRANMRFANGVGPVCLSGTNNTDEGGNL